MAVPMPSDPVSPMKIRAGAALNQRKPAQAPIMAAAMAASSRARRVAVDGDVAELVEADHGERREREDRRPGGQAVEPVGEVDGIAEADDHQHGHDDPTDLAQVDPDRVVAGERQVGVDPEPRHAQHREGDGR